MSNFMVNPSVWTTEYVKKADHRSIDRADEYLGRPTAFRLEGDIIEAFFVKCGWIRFSGIQVHEVGLHWLPELPPGATCIPCNGTGREYDVVERGWVDCYMCDGKGSN